MVKITMIQLKKCNKPEVWNGFHLKTNHWYGVDDSNNQPIITNGVLSNDTFIYVWRRGTDNK